MTEERICENCEKLTCNKKFCSNDCRFTYLKKNNLSFYNSEFQSKMSKKVKLKSRIKSGKSAAEKNKKNKVGWFDLKVQRRGGIASQIILKRLGIGVYNKIYPIAKGIKKTIEQRQVLSELHKGKKLSEKHKKAISIGASGENNSMFGKVHNIKSKQKMSISHKLYFSNAINKNKFIELKKNFYQQHPNFGKGRVVSLETRNKISLAHRGKASSMKGLLCSQKVKEKISINTKKAMTVVVKNKIKLARAKQILPKKDTSIEIKIQNFLKQLNIDFFTHQYIKEIEHGYQCDILIPSKNLVIECDGNYWHKYPIGNDIDHIRTKELIEKGFKVLRLWEVEIKKMELNEFKEKLK